MDLSSIKNQLKELEQKQAQALAELEQAASKAFESLMTAKEQDLKAMCIRLDNSRDLTQVEHDDYFHTWIRVDIDSIIGDLYGDDPKFIQGLFKNYMSENYFIEVDFKNNCITQCLGPAILINHDGDVLDQDLNKWIFKKTDYETKEQLFDLIEKHMDKIGHFPSVIKVDQHGNASFINTQKSEA